MVAGNLREMRTLSRGVDAIDFDNAAISMRSRQNLRHNCGPH
jgi:hypothetical protein